MMPVLLHVLLVIQFVPSTMITYDFSGSSSSSSSTQLQTARLDALARQIVFQPMTEEGSTTSTSASVGARDIWNPIQLDTTGPTPSALTAGSLWSLPQWIQLSSSSSSSTTTPQTDLSTSIPLPFIVVASGKRLRFYSPTPRATTNASVVREFVAQPLLVPSPPTSGLDSTDVVLESRVSLCICGMAIDSPSQPLNESSLYSKLYYWDSFGALNLIRFKQSRVSEGNNQAWQMLNEEKLARPEQDRLNTPTPATATSTSGDSCPPCFGDVIDVNSTTSSTGGLFYSPRSFRSQSVLFDSNNDGLLDYFVIRSSVQDNLIPISPSDYLPAMPSSATTSIVATTVPGVEVLAYINHGLIGANISEQFEFVSGSVTTTNGLFFGRSFSRLTPPALFHAPTVSPTYDEPNTRGVTEDFFTSTRVHEGLRGAEMLRLMKNLLITSSDHHPASSASLKSASHSRRSLAASATPIISTNQIYRQPESVSFGQFDADGHIDLVIGVTEYLNGSRVISTNSNGSNVTTNGVLIRRRLLTLFGTSNDAFHFKFDPVNSLSDPFIESNILVPNTILNPKLLSSNSTFKPLLSSMITLEGEYGLGTSQSNIAILTDSMVRSFPISTRTISALSPSVIDLGFQPFPFEVRSLPSPFYASADQLKSYQQSNAMVIKHDVTQSRGRMKNLRSDPHGKWMIMGSSPNSPTISAHTNTTNTTAVSISYSDPSTLQQLHDLNLDTASQIDLGALNSGVTNNSNGSLVLLSDFTLGPHPSVVVSSIGTINDFNLVNHYIDSLVSSSGVQPRVDSSWQNFYTSLIPSLESFFNSTDPSDLSTHDSQATLLLNHDLRVLEYYRSGWTEGFRLDSSDLLGLQVIHGTDQTNDAWKKIENSPITWSFLALITVILGFILWLLYRRNRADANHRQHVLEEIRTVLANGQLSPIRRPEDADPDAASPSAFHRGLTPPTTNDSSSLPQPYSSAPYAPAAPPNTAHDGSASSPHLPDSMSIIPDGILTHRPKIEAVTAQGSATSSSLPQSIHDLNPHSSSFSSSSPSTSPVSLQMPAFHPATHPSISPASTSTSTGFVMVTPSPTPIGISTTHAMAPPSLSNQLMMTNLPTQMSSSSPPQSIASIASPISSEFKED